MCVVKKKMTENDVYVCELGLLEERGLQIMAKKNEHTNIHR